MKIAETAHILSKIRELFTSKHVEETIHAYIVFSNDCHMSEYTSEVDQRRQYISRFYGSAGTAVLTASEAILWTDGRYHQEAEDVLDNNWQLMKLGLDGVPNISEWLAKLPYGTIIATDPSYVSYSEWCKLQRAVKHTTKKLIAVKNNLVDLVWKADGKIEQQWSKIYIHGLQFCGKTWLNKLTDIRKDMEITDCDVLVLSALDEIAWLFNLRASDIHCCPVFKAFSLITANTAYLFIHHERMTTEIANHLNINRPGDLDSVLIRPYSDIADFLGELSQNATRVWINDSTPAFLALTVAKSKLFVATNPVKIRKAVKNDIELCNIKTACIRDAACLCEFFGFLEKLVKNDVKIDEYEAAQHLDSIRQKMTNFICNSFDPISSVGSNGAIIHYRPKQDDSKYISKNLLYLCDSGGNYLDGTTDITRTLHFGKATEYEKECYTLVLKGHIALTNAVFPKGCTGTRLDVIARQFLWAAGLDYMHGTGHGIGMFLNVHEGPQSISCETNSYKLEIGNLLSNEPGYYESGKFGIRIESMMSVIPSSSKYSLKGSSNFYTFDIVSFVPMHLSLIKSDMLTLDEKYWLNSFNQKCIELITPELERLGFKDGLEYLRKNTFDI